MRLSAKNSMRNPKVTLKSGIMSSTSRNLGVLKAEVGTAETRGRTTRISLPTIPAGELEKEISESFKQKKGGA